MRRLIVVYDVSGLPEAQVDGLVGEALAQSESSDLHPDVDAYYETVADGEPGSALLLARVLGIAS